MLAKLRRGEAFAFTWREDVSTGGGRTSVYVHPGASLVFKFHGGRTPKLNPEWLRALTHAATSPTGLYVVPEPAERYPEVESREQMVFREVPAESPPDP